MDSLELPSGQNGRSFPGLQRIGSLARLSIVKSNVGSRYKPFIVGRVWGSGALTGLTDLELEALERAKEQAREEALAGKGKGKAGKAGGGPGASGAGGPT